MGRSLGSLLRRPPRWTSVRPRRSRWRCRWRSASPPAVGPFPASQEQIRPGAGSLSGRVVLDHAHTLKLDVVAMPNEDTTALVVAAAVDAAGVARDGATVNGVPVVVDVNAAAVVRAVIVSNAGVVDVDGGVGVRAVDHAPPLHRGRTRPWHRSEGSGSISQKGSHLLPYPAVKHLATAHRLFGQSLAHAWRRRCWRRGRRWSCSRVSSGAAMARPQLRYRSGFQLCKLPERIFLNERRDSKIVALSACVANGAAVLLSQETSR